MTVESSILEQLDLSDFEFDLPCSITNSRTKKPCGKAATWILVLRKHCPKTRPFTHLICEDHYQYVIDGGTAYCGACDTGDVVMLDHALQLERLRP